MVARLREMSPVNASILPRPIGRQREVLYLPPDGHTVVLGTAGSGKTTLAILRALYLATPDVEHGGRVLLVTFNRCLVTYMKHLAGTIQGEVVVENYHHFARGYLASKGKLSFQSIADADDRLRFIRSALREAQDSGMRNSTLQHPVEFFDEEFQWIQQHGIRHVEHYVQANHIGRTTTRIAERECIELFDVYARYLRQRQQNGKLYDWYDLASAVLSELKTDQEQRHYRHVVIDEGQDFSPQMLRSLAALIPQNGSLTFFGDIAQQIYGYRISWRNAGLMIDDTKSIWRFEENYRNTKQISQLALALASMPDFPTDPDLVEPTDPIAYGPLPALVQQPNEQEEMKFVISRAAEAAQTRTVAILFRSRKQEKFVCQRYHIPTWATRLHRELTQWPSTPGLFYGTYHAAKGLEFDMVFLPLLSDERWPRPCDIKLLGTQEARRRNSQLLYVGITRARSDLVLTYTENLTSLLPSDAKDLPLYQR